MNSANECRKIESIYPILMKAVSEVVEACEQCGKCPASCPVSRHIDGYNPRQIVLKVSLGRIDGLLKSDFLWTCTSCLKCKERCPEMVSPYDVILLLRNLAVRVGCEYPKGYDEFVDAVLKNGFAQQPQIVRTRSREQRDRLSLGLPDAPKPQDMERFREALERAVREWREI